MATITLRLAALPDLPGEPGPFDFVLERPAGDRGTAVLTIPIVNRGPESYAESAAQERWVSQRFGDLEMCFAGAWRTDDLRRFDAVADALGALAGAAPLPALWQLTALRTQAPPQQRDARGVALVSPRADVGEAARQAARREDLAAFDAVIAQLPDNAEAWLLRAARRHGEHEDYAGALEDFARAAALEPASPQAWSGQGAALIALGRHAEAVAPLERAVALTRGAAEARLHLAYALEKAGAYQRAVAQLREAAPPKKAGPARARDCAAHQARARCLAALGDSEQALQALTAAARCQPNNPAVWLQRAQLLDTTADGAAQALEAAAKASALAGPGEIEPLLWHAALLRGRGRAAEALAVLQTAAQRAGADPRLSAERGMALCDLGRHAEALAELDAYLGQVTWLPAQLARARCRQALGDIEGALAQLEAVLAGDPRQAEALTLRQTLEARR